MLLFISKQQASECLNLSSSTLKKYRLNGEWIEGLHWVREQSAECCQEKKVSAD